MTCRSWLLTCSAAEAAADEIEDVNAGDYAIEASMIAALPASSQWMAGLPSSNLILLDSKVAEIDMKPTTTHQLDGQILLDHGLIGWTHWALLIQKLPTKLLHILRRHVNQ
jgi:hypothetical protein